MNLLTVSTSYLKAKKKYKRFGAPTIKIKVDGMEMTKNGAVVVDNVRVDLSIANEASGCSFDVFNEYVPKNSDFNRRSAVAKLEIGASVSVELGYIETESVFEGLITEVEYNFGDEVPYIHVECTDAKILLMKQRRLELFSQKTIKQTIEEILGEAPFSSYIKGKKIEISGAKIEMLPAVMETDFQFLQRHAEYYGYEFFIIQGKVYFRKPPASASSVITLKPGELIYKAKLSLRGEALFKKSKVFGINPEDDKGVEGEASIKGKFSPKKGGSKLLGASTQTYFDPLAISKQAAKDRAEVLAKKAQASFGVLECEIKGIPEIGPGRNVKINGLSKEMDKSYYITKVTHSADSSGYTTTIEGRLSSL